MYIKDRRPLIQIVRYSSTYALLKITPFAMSRGTQSPSKSLYRYNGISGPTSSIHDLFQANSGMNGIKELGDSLREDDPSLSKHTLRIRRLRNMFLHLQQFSWIWRGGLSSIAIVTTQCGYGGAASATS